MSVRVLLAEDQAMVRGAIAALLALEEDIEIVAEAGDVLAGKGPAAEERGAKANPLLVHERHHLQRPTRLEPKLDDSVTGEGRRR